MYDNVMTDKEMLHKLEKELEEIRGRYLGKDAEIWYFPHDAHFLRTPEIVEINGERTRWDWYKKNSIGKRIVMPVLWDTILILTSVFIYNWAPFSPKFHFYEYSYHKDSLKVIEERISRKTKK